MNYSEIRKRAREDLNGNGGMAIIASLIASVFGASGNGGLNFNFNFEESDVKTLQGTEFENFSEQIEFLLKQFGGAILTFFAGFFVFALIMAALMFCLGSIVKIGYQKFNLNLVDSSPLSIATLFSYFNHWKNAILTNLLQTAYVFLWSLLCVIPGIIAQYNYAMTPYILAENPELSPKEVLQKSKEMMYGHRMELFLLNLSFIGWSILAVLTCGIGFIWLVPYINTANAEFYREISGTKCSYQYNII